MLKMTLIFLFQFLANGSVQPLLIAAGGGGSADQVSGLVLWLQEETDDARVVSSHPNTAYLMNRFFTFICCKN